MRASRSPLASPDPQDAAALDEWLEARSQRLARKIERILSRIVREVFSEFITSVEDMTVTAAGDPGIINKIPPMWQMALPEFLPDLEETYLQGGLSAYTVASAKVAIPEAFVAAWTTVVNEQAIEYMASATNRMGDVGRTLWKDVSKTATRAIEQGLGRDELADQLRDLSSRFAGFRADVIARTEVNAAYSNGDWAGDLALGEFGPLEKVWVATGDARTRPEHLEAADQTVPFDQPFDVGGEAMMYPHDSAGSAWNVVNCRCHYEPLYAGDERPDGSIVTVDEIIAGTPGEGDLEVVDLEEDSE